MLSNENGLKQQLEGIADQAQTVTLIYGRLQQIESEIREFRSDILEFRATNIRLAELIAAQQVMIRELVASIKVQAPASESEGASRTRHRHVPNSITGLLPNLKNLE